MYFEGTHRVLGQVEVESTLKKVIELDAWVNRSIYVMRDAQVMKALTPSTFDRTDEVTQKALLDVLEPLVKPFCGRLETLLYVDVSKLSAGKSVDLHVDWAMMHAHSRRIHIPLQTTSEVKMGWLTENGAESAHLEAGKVYEVNNMVPHAVHNGSEADRLHVIADVISNDWHDLLRKQEAFSQSILGSATNRYFGELPKTKLYHLIGRPYGIPAR